MDTRTKQKVIKSVDEALRNEKTTVIFPNGKIKIVENDINMEAIKGIANGKQFFTFITDVTEEDVIVKSISSMSDDALKISLMAWLINDPKERAIAFEVILDFLEEFRNITEMDDQTEQELNEVTGIMKSFINKKK